MLRDLATVGLLAGVGWLIYRTETIMANFDALNAKLDEQDAARAAAVERVSADIQDLRDKIDALELDTADQAAVDAVVGRIQSNIDALNNLDPVRADDSGAPAGPAEPAPAEEPVAGEPQA